MKLNLFREKKASVTIYIVFIIVALIVVMISAVFAPMGIMFNQKMYAAGEDIILRANASVSEINNASVRAEIYDTYDLGLDGAQNNIDVNTAIFQYGWVFVILCVGLVLFLYTRSLVEVRGGGGLV